MAVMVHHLKRPGCRAVGGGCEDATGIIWWRPAAPGFAALAIATPVVVDREVGEA